MRDLFPGYYRFSPQDTESFWSEACFVFDTNVLLEPYALPEQAREEFLVVLEKIAQRIWIPYQVALEFHRNRFSKISAASKNIADLKKTALSNSNEIISRVNAMQFEKWNTGIDDLPKILEQLQSAHAQLDVALEAAKRKLPQVSLDDPIALRLSKLLTGNVGPPPPNQTALDELCTGSADRYTSSIPPGFSDQKKGEAYFDRGLRYEAKHGDLIIWRQIIQHVKDKQLRNIIFVTADVKEDWWISEKSGQRLGPHPALIEEFLRETAARRFWIYTPDQFLEHARKQFAVAVADQTLEQVKQSTLETSSLYQLTLVSKRSRSIGVHQGKSSFNQLDFSDLQIVREWVQHRLPSSMLTAGLGVDIAVEDGGEITAIYQIIKVKQLALTAAKIAATELFDDISQYILVVLEGVALADFAFGDNQDLFTRLLEIMHKQKIQSTVFLDVSNGAVNVVDEFSVRSL